MFDNLKIAGQYSTPENLVSLIAEISRGLPAKTILDPACGTATLLTAVAKGKEVEKIVGIDINRVVSQVAEATLKKSGLHYQLINADYFHESIEEKFDLVVCTPPFGMRMELKINNKKKIRGIEAAFILRSLQSIKPDGYAIFITPGSLLSNKRDRFFRDYVSQNYSLEAIVSLPSNSFQPYAGVKTSLVIIKNSKQSEKVFLAEFAEMQALTVIVSNFQKKTSNNNLSQGFWVDIDIIQKTDSVWAYGRYKGIKDFETKKANSKYPLRLLSELVSIGKSKSDTIDTILIQRISNQPKVILKDELPEKSNAKHYIELSLSSDEILPQYLKLYLNSEYGRIQLLSIVGGGVIPSLRADNLESIYIEVPDLVTQIKIVSTAQKLAEVSATIQITSQSFQSQLFNYSDLLPLIEQFDKVDEKDVSFENLISPLATSFRISTKGSPNINSQLDSYFKMFEMIAVLNSIVLISALPQGLREQYEKEIWTDNKSQYSRASFGIWVALYRRLSNLYKKLKKDDNEKEIFNNLPFGADFYSNLSNPDVLTILDTITEKRNKYGGAAHGGIVTEIVAQKAVSEIHPLAMNVFTKLSKAYSGTDLIYPQTMKKSNGLYKIRIKRLQGTHYPYAEQDIQTETDLNTESLYLYNPVSKSRLELMSEFIKLIQCEHCGNWSIYFYSKADSKKAHYISFQNEIHEYKCQPSGLLNSFGAS
jgi:tRNA1(Val) A37 N6-methylase TrmN6